MSRHIVANGLSGKPSWGTTLCGLRGSDATYVDRITIEGAAESGPEMAATFCSPCNVARVQLAQEERDDQFRAGTASAPATPYTLTRAQLVKLIGYYTNISEAAVDERLDIVIERELGLKN